MSIPSGKIEENSQDNLSRLLELRFTESTANQALNACDNNVESAVLWILQGSDDDESSLNAVEVDYSLKMVLIVRTDLGMTAGKIAAQCVHAALGAYRIAQERCPDVLRIWEYSGEKAVCLKCKSDTEMNELEARANEAGIVAYKVIDAGRTQIDPGSQTVLAIGPAHENIINSVSGSLKLY